MKNADQKKLARDMALNSDAVRVVLFIETMGSGKHPIPNDDFRAVLHMAGPKKVSLALRLAESSGWITRSKGGWGSPDFYEYTGGADPSKTEGTEGNTDPSKTEGTEGNTDPATLVVTVASLSPPKRKAQGTDPAKMEGSTRACASKEERESQSVIHTDRGGYEIDKRVEEALADGFWDGFRNSIKDYFRSRVETSRQWGYLMTVQTWFQGSTAAPKGFFHLNAADQRLLIASAVNELLNDSPEDEKLGYRSSRGKVGNASVLRAKVEYHIRRHEKHGKKERAAQGMLGIGDPEAFFPESRDGGEV